MRTTTRRGSVRTLSGLSGRCAAAVAALGLLVACSGQQGDEAQEQEAGAQAEAAAESDASAGEETAAGAEAFTGESLLEEGETLQEAVERVRDERPETPEEFLKGATILVQAGQAPEALWLLEEGLTRFPESDLVRVALGRVALMVGDASRARTTVQTVEPDSDQHAQALVIQAQAELRLGELEKALELLEEAEQRYPDIEGIRTARIQVLIQERQLDEAFAALEEAKADLDPEEDARNLEVLEARIQAAQGEMDKAAEQLTAMVEEDAAYLPAWQALVQVMARQQKLPELAERLETTLEADPDINALYPMLATVKRRLGEDEEAEKLLKHYVDVADSPGAYVTLARDYLERGNSEKVVETLAEALEEYPDEPMIRLGYAESLIDVGRVGEARERLEELEGDFEDAPVVEYLRARIQLAEGDAKGAAERLKNLAPQLDRPETHYWLGRALQQLGDLDGAQRRFGLAWRRDPNSMPAALASLAVAEQKGDWRSVASTALRIIQRDPDRVEAFSSLGFAMLRLGEPERAEQVAKQFAARHPEEPSAQLLLARALREQGKLDEAEQALADAEEKFGGTANVAAERGLFLGATNRVDEGLALLRDAIEESPDDSRLHVALAALLFQKGDAAAGSQAVDRARELDPTDPMPLRLRLQFRAARGNLEGAIRDAETYLAEKPRDPEAHFILGTLHLKKGSQQAAAESFRTAAELDDQAVLARNNLAMLLAEQGDMDGALEAAQEAYALEKENPYVLDTLGWLYLKQGLVERSISILEQARDVEPWLPDAQYHLALAYQEAGRTEQARTLLTDLTSRSDAGKLRSEAQNALRDLQ